jgi:WhiB family redox-sensing transcriptional regulator
MPNVRFIDPGEAAEWEERARCRNIDDQSLFFPEHGNRSPSRAKAICNRCDVRADCLRAALENDERFGIWGGLTEKERRALQRRAGAA